MGVINIIFNFMVCFLIEYIMFIVCRNNEFRSINLCVDNCFDVVVFVLLYNIFLFILKSKMYIYVSLYW